MQHRDYDHFCLTDIVEDPIVPDTQTVRGSLPSAQPLDAAPAQAVRLVSQMGFYRIKDRHCIHAA